ncbi:MAG: CPBP family intramembrane metalloprotease [Lachnospiraceae bacterium]|nr:CPBP family intramembrane metalloprotease [Lachnospiraceae bacterium]
MNNDGTIKKAFRTDRGYRNNLQSYTKKDSYIALAFYAFNMLLLYATGKIHFYTGKYLGIVMAIVNIAVVLLIARARHSDVGICVRGIIPGIVTGFIMGIIFILGYTILPGIAAGASFLPVRTILYNVFYYFVIIAFEEELSFRGFIQPRLFPLFKKEWLTLLVGGIMFVLMHYPYQMAARGMGITDYFPLFIAGAPIQLMWHYVFSWFYGRFGNIYGGTVLHGFIDMSMGIFG